MAATVADLEALYRERYRVFLRVATAISGEAACGADAVQDGFARAITSRAAFRGDGPLEAWVWRIVVNAARATRTKAQPVDISSQAPGSPGSAWDTPSDPDPHGVHALLGALPERERLVVFLRYFADLDYRSIATALEIKVGTV